MGHHTGGNLLHSERPSGRQVASKLDFSALKVKTESPSMGHAIMGLTHRLTDSHRDCGWVFLAVCAPVKSASMDARLELGEERAHKKLDRAEGPLQDTDRSAPYSDSNRTRGPA